MTLRVSYYRGSLVRGSAEATRHMLEVKNVECVRGDRSLFRNVNFTLEPGTLLQLTGRNGSGKTSLLRIICGLAPCEDGEIRWRGANIRSLGEDYFTAVTYVGHRNGVKEEMTSAENLRISAGLAGRPISKDKALSNLAKMGLAGREHLPVRLLSEGQRRRSALARLLSSETPLWLLDEVLGSLDQDAVAVVTAMIEEHLTNGGMAIVATHQELNFKSANVQRLELDGVAGAARPEQRW